MKKVFSMIVFLVCLSLVSFAWADPEAEKEPPKTKGQCPVTQVVGDLYDCFKCHAQGRGFLTQIHETAPDAHMDYPVRNFRIIDGVGYFLFTDINSEEIADILFYLDSHKINKLVLEAYSPGGSMMAAWRIVGLMDVWKSRGNVIETRVHGMAASAGFMVFANGSKGNRLASPTAELMWHELISFKMFDISSPSDKEDEARVLRHFQDNSNHFLARNSNMTKEEIDEHVHKKQFWMTGAEAKELGFADGLLGE